MFGLLLAMVGGTCAVRRCVLLCFVDGIGAAMAVDNRCSEKRGVDLSGWQQLYSKIVEMLGAKDPGEIHLG